ncbi:hypothetical protein P4N68_11150 [Corynebacterium felinum]|uniref:Uncharacterized protein n=1 Tax=Corynebacterium felinum TaxID=131318 RepID=A0ABU2B7V2_9CORY|nr:hypothetical protein [Corynebacterium felinum]MDF5821631.1 hypothetical protein [Corynebacterium felinum]MDR7354690.1 hypothetical protein [Corynebacterium felinum]WJY94054.1 hypothetical protein CFELI_02060 [Corynebacterium felinum]
MRTTFRALVVAAAVAVACPVVPAFAHDGHNHGASHVGTPDSGHYDTVDAMPHKYYYKAAADGAAYEAELKSYLAVSQIRHLYHSAAYGWKYADYYSPKISPEERNAINEKHQRSEDGCYTAKGRTSIALLKYEGNEEARKLDTSKIGFDIATTEKAIELLKADSARLEKERDAKKAANEIDDATVKLYNSRMSIIGDALKRLPDVLKALKANEPVHEYDAFSVVDWGIKDGFVKCEKGESDDNTCHDLYNPNGRGERKSYKGHPLSQAAKSLTVTQGDISKSVEENKPGFVTDATANKATLLTAFGEIKPPAASQPTSAPATSSSQAPSSSAPASTTSQPPSSAKPEPTPAPSDRNKTIAIVLGVLAGLGALFGLIAVAVRQFFPQLLANLKF